MGEWMDGWAEGSKSRIKDFLHKSKTKRRRFFNKIGWMDGLLDGWIVGWIVGWMDCWMDRWIVGWMGVSKTCLRHILQVCSPFMLHTYIDAHRLGGDWYSSSQPTFCIFLELVPAQSRPDSASL